MTERGSIPMAALIGFAIFILVVAGFFVCGDALVDDESEVDDLGAPAWVADRDDHDRESERGCAGSDDPCQTREGSPSFEDSPVDIHFGPVCVQDGACRWESGPEESG